MSESAIVVAVVTAAGFLGLSFAALLRGAKSRMALAFAQLTMMLAFYKLFEPLSDLTGNPSWDTFEFMAASLAAPPLLAFFCIYLGISRRLRWPLRIASAYFGAVALALALSEAFVDGIRVDGDRWSTLMLAGLLPTSLPLVGVAIWQAWSAPEEVRLRTHLIIVAVLLGVGGVTTDLLHMAGFGVPKLSTLGLFGSVVPLGLVATESNVIRGPSGVVAATVAAVSLVAVIAQILVFSLAGGDTSLLVGGSLAVTAVLLVTVRPLFVAHTRARHRNRQLATLGRLSEQMAHDLRNPLTALIGCVELLRDAASREERLDGSAPYLDLLVAQSRRIQTVVDDYRRLGSVEPRLRDVDVDLLVQQVGEGFRLTVPSEIEVVVDGRVGAPGRLDPELVEALLENLLRNAREALGTRGRIELSASVARTWMGRRLRLEVRDDGPGMDPSTAEHAFDEVFTTKVEGTGLGLPYVARVAEAHGGSVRLQTQPGRGTRVIVDLPPPALDPDTADVGRPR